MDINYRGICSSAFMQVCNIITCFQAWQTCLKAELHVLCNIADKVWMLFSRLRAADLHVVGQSPRLSKQGFMCLICLEMDINYRGICSSAFMQVCNIITCFQAWQTCLKAELHALCNIAAKVWMLFSRLRAADLHCSVGFQSYVSDSFGKLSYMMK
jgi:hypothetical protein